MPRQRHRWRRSGSSHFDEEGTPRNEGIACASGMASSDVVLGDLVESVPSMLFEMSVTRVLTCLPLPRLGTSSSSVAPTDTMHVNFLPLFVAFAFFRLNVI